MNSESSPFECRTSQLFKTVHSEIFELEQQDLTACLSVCISDCLSGRQEPTFLLAFKRERLCLNKSKHNELSNVMIILTHLRRYLRWLECLAVVPRVVSSSSFCLPAWIWLVYKIIVLSADHFFCEKLCLPIYRVCVFTGSGLITGSDRIGPEIGLFLCLTDCFFFTRMMYIKDYVFSAICMHLNILILI